MRGLILRSGMRAAVAAICGWAVVSARADRVDDLARIHIEALGGPARVEALAAFRASGQVLAPNSRLRFVATAARPDRVRLEIVSGARTMVQGSDGVEPPWEFDTGKWPPRYQTMPESIGRTFARDAEFDDPLVAGPARGYAFDYVGEVEVDRRKFIRVNVTRKPSQVFALLVDPESYLIVLRVEKRVSDARSVQVVTRFEDYRPVLGVLLPHRIVEIVDGRATRQTDIESIEPNPALTADTFSRPKSEAPAATPGN